MNLKKVVALLLLVFITGCWDMPGFYVDTINTSVGCSDKKMYRCIRSVAMGEDAVVRICESLEECNTYCDNKNKE